MSALIRFFLSNFTLTFLLAGFLSAAIALALKARPLPPPCMPPYWMLMYGTPLRVSFQIAIWHTRLEPAMAGFNMLSGRGKVGSLASRNSN